LSLRATKLFSLADNFVLKSHHIFRTIQSSVAIYQTNDSKNPDSHQDSKLAIDSPCSNDIWICGSCDVRNIIANNSITCPVCAHAKYFEISCCTNPGQQLRPTVIVLDASHVQSDAWVYELAGPLCSYGTIDPLAYGSDPNDIFTFNGSFTNARKAGSIADGSWVCEECGCPNSETCYTCMACG
jgi:hypothetical protein